MALNSDEKQVAALLAKKNPDVDYMIRLSSDESFAKEEIINKKESLKEELLKEELLKEKESHEKHIQVLESRLEKVNFLLSSIEVLENVSPE